MEAEQKQIFNWKNSLMTFAIIIVTAIVAGGGTWLFMNGYETTYNKITDNEIKNLENSLGQLRKQIGQNNSINENTTVLGAPSTNVSANPSTTN